jgi:hypothetical protein
VLSWFQEPAVAATTLYTLMRGQLIAPAWFMKSAALVREDDWRSDTKKCNEVLFRLLLIRQYSLQAHAKQPNAVCHDR